MARLREETRTAHEALHHAPGLAPLLTPTLSVAVYRRILIRFDRFMAAAEHAILTPADPWFARNGFERRSRRPDLAHDLAWLEAVEAFPEAADERTIPPRVSLAVPGGEGAALGLLYVTEGSRLGGKGMARHLSAVLPVEARAATRFLGSGGVDLAAHWGEVGRLIDRLGGHPSHADAAVMAAQRSFAVLSSWFSESP